MADTIKLIYTYTIALVLIVGGLGMLYVTRLDPAEADVQGMRLLLSGFIGAAIQFVFNRDTATATARQIERSYAAGAAPVVTTTAGPPASMTTEPVASSPVGPAPSI